MPLFDFACTACGHRCELLVRVGSEPACPECGSSALRKEVSAPVAPGQSKAIISSARRQATREGHFSNYSKAERGKLLR